MKNMRKISFRAWDKEERRMWLNVQNAYDTLGKHCEHDDCDCFFEPESFCGVLENERYVVMQFTGLLDRNGKQIYEGDILRYPLEEEIISIRWDTTGANWQFDTHKAFDDGVGRGNWDFKSGIAKNSEVIGNVFENPELLTNSKE
jgi:uncharacterized phage protein (TIGR01671 family)